MAAPAPAPSPTADGALDRIAAAVGPRGWTTDAGEMRPFLEDWRGQHRGRARMLVRPASTEEVAAVVRVCAEANVPIVPQGGNTGMCGGATPLEDGEEIVLSLARMNRVRAIDPVNDTIEVEAGCVLRNVREAALAADRYFPLSLAAEGSCTIGGNLSTNAGGTNVLRYGNARELALGLEAVLPDGRVWDGLAGLRKDNTGYDLKHLFLGAEGTLGVITAAVLKLFPPPRSIHAAWCAVRDIPAALALLERARAGSGGRVETFELVERPVVDLVLKHIPGRRDPLPARHGLYVLLELTSTAPEDDALAARFEAILEGAMEDGIVLDAAIARSEGQRRELWALRENATESQKLEGASLKHDVSVPVSAIPDFCAAARRAVSEIDPRLRPLVFGHAGDGNVHYNIAAPEGDDGSALFARREEINRAVHDAAHAHGGSFSAEHGIGRLKRGELARYKPEVALDTMRAIKRALDPKGIMNRGKVI